MADYTVSIDYNKGTDASTDWTGSTIAMSGSAGANEFRPALSTGSQTTSTGNAAWPYMSLPASGLTIVDRLYAAHTDTSLIQVSTYDGTNGKARVFRYNFNNAGTAVTAMQASFFGDNTHANPSAGTQPPGSHNDALTNGTSESSNKSLILGNFYGSGLTAGGSQETPSAGTVGSSPGSSTGTSGAVTTSAGAWMTNWQDLAGWNDYVVGVAIPAALTAFFWYFTLIFRIAASMATTPGGWTPVMTLYYAYA